MPLLQLRYPIDEATRGFSEGRMYNYPGISSRHGVQLETIPALWRQDDSNYILIMPMINLERF